jgi:hypothetical protein
MLDDDKSPVIGRWSTAIALLDAATDPFPSHVALSAAGDSTQNGPLSCIPRREGPTREGAPVVSQSCSHF